MKYLTLPEDFVPQRSWAYGGLQGLVDVKPYSRTSHADVRWCAFVYVAPGDAAVYPYKFEMPQRSGVLQFKLAEVVGWRYEMFVLEALADGWLGRTAARLTDRDEAILPGLDNDWLLRALGFG